MANLSDVEGYNEPTLLDEDDAFYDEDLQKDMYLTFHLGGEDYGIPIQSVIEIIGVQKTTMVPDMPPYVVGVINLRGAVIPVVDIRVRFGLEPRLPDDRTCVIVVQLAGTQVGAQVDQVRDVALIPEGAIKPPPKVRKGPATRFIAGLGMVEDTVKILLDVMRLFYDEGESGKGDADDDESDA